MSFLGIDLGTSGLRALLVDGDSRPIGSAQADYGVSRPHSGWSEQDPATWITALNDAISQLRRDHPEFSAIRGIGVSGHMHGATLLDRDDQVLRPCILWNDTRAHAEARRLDQMPAFRQHSGNIVFPGFTAPKLDWVRQNEPAVFAKIAKVLLPAAYLNLYLTGDHVADMSDSAGTAWLDVHRRDWSAELLATTHMRPDQMPRLVEGSARAGTLRTDLAASWGLGADVAVAGGAGDNAAAACGIGALQAGQGFVSLGTSGVLMLARDRCNPAPDTALHTFCHAVPGSWYQMGVMLSAADCLTWLSGITGQTPQALTGELGDVIRAPGRVSFLPYLSGERTPHNDADIRAGFTGIGVDTTRADLTRAVLEGVCFGLRDTFEAIKSTGGTFERVFAIGGGSASTYWTGLLASVLQIPLHLPQGGEFGAALGAARLGITAATGAEPQTVMTAPRDSTCIQPNRELAADFDAAYDRFQAGYPALKSIQ